MDNIIHCNVDDTRKDQTMAALYNVVTIALLVTMNINLPSLCYSQYLGILVPSGAVVSKKSVGRSRLRFLRRLFTGNR